MKKRLMLALMLLLCAVLLCSCAEKKKYEVGGTAQNQGGQENLQTQANLGEQSAPAEEEIDPLAEEDDYTGEAEYWGEDLTDPTAVAATPVPTVRSEYAGATPVVIDPIDKPTPTPVPALQLTYATYDATNIGLSFEGPAGWTVGDTSGDSYIIQNPNRNIDYPATLTLRAERVSSDYSTSELKTIVQGMLDSIATVGFEEYSPSQTASRDLLGKSGIYANYSGTLLDGRRVSGRVHAVCVDKVLYTIHISAPYAQWNDYKEMVYDHLRDTLVIVK